MIKNCQSFIYNFDFIGTTPQLYIFNNKKYKSFFSSITSILFIMFSIIFIVISIIEYLKYNTPIVVYSKANDDLTNRTVLIKDTLFMFQLIDTTNANIINNSIAYFESDYTIIYDNGTFDRGTIELEKCEFEKNINLKYKDYLTKKLNFGRPIEEFYCIKSKYGNISLFYNPNIGYSFINLQVIIKNNTNYIPEKIQSLIISENNVIDHNNKDKPISESFIYYMTTSFSSSEFTTIHIDIQYIKYDSDDGLFFKKNDYYYGLSFADMNFFKSINDNFNYIKDLEERNSSKIGTIFFQINKSYYDNYKRSYQKLQSLLAEITSVISLIFEVGRQISIILCDKKMSRDIIRSLLDKDKNTRVSTHNYHHIKKDSFGEHNNNKQNNSSERNGIKLDLMNKSSGYNYQEKIDKNKLNISKEAMINKNDKKNYSNISNKILKSINSYHILKSYLCFNDKRTKLINISHNIIIEDMSVERILKRFYKLENIYHFFSNEEKEKYNITKNKRFKEINKYIYEIKKDSSLIKIKDKKISTKTSNNKEENV